MKRAMRKQVSELNGVIASRNLYQVLPGGNRRMFNAEVINGVVCVHDLYTDAAVTVEGNNFVDGYGQAVVL